MGIQSYCARQSALLRGIQYFHADFGPGVACMADLAIRAKQLSEMSDRLSFIVCFKDELNADLSTLVSATLC